MIGGEFVISREQVLCSSQRYIYRTPQYSLGRTCLYLILESIQERSSNSGQSESLRRGLLLPDYICYSVVEVCRCRGIEVFHYHIKEDLLPDLDSVRSKADRCEAILLVNYFGVTDLDQTIRILREENSDLAVIIDDVQNFYGFGGDSDYDYCFTSYRKWFAVPDGADILYRNNSNIHSKSLNEDPEYVKYKAAGNLLKNYSDLIDDQISLELIEKGEQMMNEEYMFACSKTTCILLQSIDMNSAEIERKRNAAILHEGLDSIGVKHIFRDDSTPMHIPVILEKGIRDRIRERLFSENIFCPIHWPCINKAMQGDNPLYETELSLVCDQRYSEDEMRRILGVIKNGLLDNGKLG